MIIESTKRKRNAIEKEKIIKLNEIREDLRIKTVKKRMKKKPASFKMKNKEIERKKINWIRDRNKSKNNKKNRRIKTKNIKRNNRKKV